MGVFRCDLLFFVSIAVCRCSTSAASCSVASVASLSANLELVSSTYLLESASTHLGVSLLLTEAPPQAAPGSTRVHSEAKSPKGALVSKFQANVGTILAVCVDKNNRIFVGGTGCLVQVFSFDSNE